MARGGIREGAGRKSAFPNKELDRPFGMDFTPAGREQLALLEARTGLSRSDILAHLTRKYARALTFSHEGVAFPGKAASNILRIRLPPEEGQLLREAQERTGKSFSDLGEALVRLYGHTETFPVRPGPDKPVQPRGRKKPARARRRA